MIKKTREGRSATVGCWVIEFELQKSPPSAQHAQIYSTNRQQLERQLQESDYRFLSRHRNMNILFKIHIISTVCI